MNIQEYWRKIREIQRGLPEVVSLTSEAVNGGRAGVVVQTDSESAAKCLFAKTHRLSTDEEVQLYLQDQKRKSRNIQLAENVRLGEITVDVGFPELKPMN